MFRRASVCLAVEYVKIVIIVVFDLQILILCDVESFALAPKSLITSLTIELHKHDRQTDRQPLHDGIGRAIWRRAAKSRSAH